MELKEGLGAGIQGARKVARGEGGKAGRDKSIAGPGKVMLKISGLYPKNRHWVACSKVLQVRTTAYPGRNGRSNYEIRKNLSFISIETCSVSLSLFPMCLISSELNLKKESI